jgi:putative GTP pyrophosphokinase
MVVIEKKDYLANHKSSGYRSYHMIVWYTVETINGPKQIHVEIQIRTMAMNFWATTEHSLQYKYKGVLPPHVSKQLEVIADSVYQLDTQMSRVRSEIIDAENHSETRTNLIKDIVTSIENLYKITNHREVEKIQDEFYRIFKMNDIDELKRFQRHLDVLAEGFRAQSVEYEAPDPRKGG